MPVVNSLHHELDFLNRPVNKILLGYVRFVRLNSLDEFPGAQQGRSKKTAYFRSSLMDSPQCEIEMR